MTDLYMENLAKGQAYEDFIEAEFKKRGIDIGMYRTREEQYTIGENALGIEIKFDSQIVEKQNLFIEIEEKTDPRNPSYVPSGIMREDNSKFYLVGDYDKAYIFVKKSLREFCPKYKLEIKTSKSRTSRGYILPISILRQHLSEILYKYLPFKKGLVYLSDTLRTVLIDGGPPVALADETKFIYNLLPVGHFYDKRYGEVYITRDKLKQIEANFGKVPSYEVPVKIGHDTGALSPGKVIAVRAKRDGLEITMVVDAETARAINNKQYRYMSAEFDENYQNKETGEFVGAVLLGAALVNQPANPYMQPLVLVDDIEPKKGDQFNMNDELEIVRKQLAEAQAQLKTANEAIETSSKKFADLEAQNKVLLAEKEKVETEKLNADVKAFADKWTAAGIPPAVVDLVKSVLLSKQAQVIKLSDNSRDDKNSLKFFDDLFAALPKVQMTQVSTQDKPEKELSDTEKSKEHAKHIAESLKG